MTSQSSPKVVFQQAMEIADPQERAAFLKRVCEGNEALRREVESLLFAYMAAGSFLAGSRLSPRELPNEKQGDRIGRYQLIQAIGEGGFGRVWMAEQLEPMRRSVALKIIKLGMDTGEVLARFEAERQALALMDHPNIARVFDGGATDSGRPYFVMELVRGLPITEFCDARRMTPTERLELFRKVCLAVQHAHQKGIIHRDLKPSNILVTLQDEMPVPKVIDFGIAKALEAQLTEKTHFTRFGQWLGTPAYMSPEQAGLGGLDVDTRSDIYSLGAILFELLTGHTLFDESMLRERGYEAILRAIREEDPPKPSTRLGALSGRELNSIAENHGADPIRMIRQLRGDPDWIVMKALEKDRARRYGTAQSLADDLRRHLANEVVLARPPSAIYRMKKAWGRHKVGFTAAAMVTFVSIVGTVVSTRQAVEASRARNVAARSRNVAEEENAGRKRQLREAARSDRLLAMALFNEGRDEEGFAHIARACDYDPDSTLAAEIAIFRLNVVNVARQVSILRGDNEFPLVRIGREERYRRIEAGEDLQLSDADFTPDGQQVVTLRDYAPADFAERNRGGGPTDAAELWDVSTGWKLQRKLVEGRVCGAPEAVRSPSDKPPGIQIFGTILTYDTNGKMLPSPDGSAEVVLENDALVLRPKAQPSESVPVAKVGTFSSLVGRFASDGLRVASAGDGPEDDAEYDYRVMLHSVPSGKAMGNCTGHAQMVTSVRFSPDCARLVTASDDTTARVWETADRRLSDRFGWDEGMLFTVAFSPDGRRIIANGASGDGRLDGLLIWDALTGERLYDDPLLQESASLVGSSTSGALAILREGGENGSGVARVWDVVNDREVARLGDRPLSVTDALFSPDDRVVAIREQDGSIRIWDTKDGHQVSEVARATGEDPTLCFSPDSRYLLVEPKQTDGDERPAVMVEVASGKVLFEMPLGKYGVGTASFNPKGTLVATGSNDAIARVWECQSGKLVATLPQTQTVRSAEFSPDGTMLAIACFRSHVVEVWNVATWQLIRRIQCSLNQEMETVKFSPDSHLLAGGGDREHVLNIWEARSGQVVASIEIPHAESRDFDFSPDGKRLVIPSRNSGEIPESGGPIVLEVPALSAPVPEWFADFLRFLPQHKIDDDGHMRVLTPLEWENLRDRVAVAAAADRSRYGELARWFLAPADQRPVRPGTSMTRHELADRLVTPQAGAVQLARALAFDPANPLAHLAMARFTPSEEAARHLRAWAHQHLPPSPSPELKARIDAIEALPALPKAPVNE